MNSYNPYNYNTMVPLVTTSQGCTKGKLDERRECCGSATSLLPGCTVNKAGEYVPIPSPGNNSDAPKGCYQRGPDGSCMSIGAGADAMCTSTMCEHECENGCWHGPNAYSDCMANKNPYCGGNGGGNGGVGGNGGGVGGNGGGGGNGGVGGNGGTPPSTCSTLNETTCDRCHWDKTSSKCLDGASPKFFDTTEGRIIFISSLVVAIAILIAVIHSIATK